MKRWLHTPVVGFKALRRWLIWVAIALLCLQLFFVLRIALMAWVSPQSTAFMRSEAWRRLHASAQATGGPAAATRPWAQQWVDSAQLSPHLKRAVIASEDDGFASHMGVDWAAMESAWSRNRQQAQRAGVGGPNPPPRIRGGSTITQQLAKNLLLSGERQLARKAQEMVLSYLLEAFLSKQRILEIYLNSVEWGEGIFGAEAAAQRYFKKPAHLLGRAEAARLAVMLPSPKFFETRQGSTYLARRTSTIVARMGAVDAP